MKAIDRYQQSERARILIQECPYNIYWLSQLMPPSNEVSCDGNCVKCWEQEVKEDND